MTEYIDLTPTAEELDRLFTHMLKSAVACRDLRSFLGYFNVAINAATSTANILQVRSVLAAMIATIDKENEE